MTQTRIIRTYSDAKAIGEVEMTDRQYAAYSAAADRDTGAIPMEDLRSYIYGCDVVFSDIVDDDVTVYVEE